MRRVRPLPACRDGLVPLRPGFSASRGGRRGDVLRWVHGPPLGADAHPPGPVRLRRSGELIGQNLICSIDQKPDRKSRSPGASIAEASTIRFSADRTRCQDHRSTPAPTWRVVAHVGQSLLAQIEWSSIRARSRCKAETRRGGRVAEGARLESVYTGNRIAGSNPAPSATFHVISGTTVYDRRSPKLSGTFRAFARLQRMPKVGETACGRSLEAICEVRLSARSRPVRTSLNIKGGTQSALRRDR